MAFTYNPANIAPDNADYESAVRYLIQDTNVYNYEVDSAEIAAIYNFTSGVFSTDTTGLVQQKRVYKTALEVAKALHTKYAKQATFSSGGTSVNLTERAKYWSTVVDDLTAKLTTLVNNGAVYYQSRAALWR